MTAVVRIERQPPLASRADRRFPVETPATSVVSTATMIAPKCVVMIDHPDRAITQLADADPGPLAHPSRPAGAGREPRRRVKSWAVDEPVLEQAPMTCSTCRVTYLPSAISSASTSSEDWVCDLCNRTFG